MLPVSRLILCPGLGYMQRPRAGTSHCSIQQESGSQPKPLNPCFIFGQQQKKTKTWSYKGTFPTWVIQPDVLDMFCLSVVESRGILLSVCCFCVLSWSHGHAGLLLSQPQLLFVCWSYLGEHQTLVLLQQRLWKLQPPEQPCSAQWLSNLFHLIAHTSLLRKWMVKTFRAGRFRALTVSLQIIHRESASSNLFFILIKWQPKIFDIPGPPLFSLGKVTPLGVDFGLLLTACCCCVMFGLD